MKPLGLYATEVRIEKSDLVAICEDRLWIRDGNELYISVNFFRETKIPATIEVNSIGSYANNRGIMPKGISWKKYSGR
ncbi:MAG: hypothetical protein WCK90_03810 [archaeon]